MGLFKKFKKRVKKAVKPIPRISIAGIAPKDLLFGSKKPNEFNANLDTAGIAAAAELARKQEEDKRKKRRNNIITRPLGALVETGSLTRVLTGS